MDPAEGQRWSADYLTRKGLLAVGQRTPVATLEASAVDICNESRSALDFAPALCARRWRRARLRGCNRVLDPIVVGHAAAVLPVQLVVIAWYTAAIATR